MFQNLVLDRPNAFNPAADLTLIAPRLVPVPSLRRNLTHG